MKTHKSSKSWGAFKRIKAIEEKKLKYFMENRQGEFRLRVIEDKTNKQKKINPRNIEEFDSDEET